MRRIPDSEIETWAQMYADGATLRQIGAHAQRDHKVVYHALKRRGITGNTRGPRYVAYTDGWCDECCDWKRLVARTGWCAHCTAWLSQKRQVFPHRSEAAVGQSKA